MPSLIEHIRSKVDARAFYIDEFPDLHWPSSSSEGRVNCCFHEDGKTPSLSLNPENGKWYCHGCDRGGNSVVSFYAERYECSKSDAARKLFKQYIHPIISNKQVRRWKRKLHESPSVLKYLQKERKLDKRIIDKRDLGWDGNRVIIPIRNEFELCVNVKLFDPLVSKGIRRGKYAIKMLNYQDENEERSYGSPPMLYPIDSLIKASESDWIFVCEGELDALVLEGMGLHVVTSTAGAKSWPAQYNSYFYNHKIATVYDNDKEDASDKKNGLPVERRVLPNLIKVAAKIKKIEIPTFVGKDVTDWYKQDENMQESEAWIKAAKKSKTLVENPKEAIRSNEAVPVPLDQASQSRWYNQRIQVDSLVTGKGMSPYILPRKFRVTCNKGCDDCPLAELDRGHKDCSIEPSDPRVLKLVDVPDTTVQRIMLTIAGLHPKPECEAKADVLDTFNLDELLLIPTIDSMAQVNGQSQYVMRSGYFIGHGLKSNRAYRFEGTTTVDPTNQKVVHLFDTSKAVQDEIETFELKSETRKALKVFRPKSLRPLGQLMSIAEWQSRNITKIRDRPDLHIAVDLAFHSVRSFNFNGELVRRAMLDILIIGDTRCGKGYVAEGLTRHYGLGEVASADNCSKAGLIGGIDQPNGRNIVKWGLIPLNNDRLVVIDEASSLSHEDISELTRIRSEGIAEITKIQRESTQANCRLIWLSNTRDGQPIMEQGTGVKAIKYLIGANEDISRFDFALTVATNEVPSEIINSEDKLNTDDNDRYARELCRQQILWAWSRTAEQVSFSRKATHRIIQQSIKFGKEFSPKIPLVQAENIRIKLAKISAAVAARLFSADDSGENLIVRSEHVDCACEFLRLIYTKPSMGYDLFSRMAIASSNIGPIDDIFKALGREKLMIIKGLLELHKITSDNLSDYYGDREGTRLFIGDLVKQGCLNRIEGGNWYLKNPSFVRWLRSQRKEKRKHVKSD